MPQPLSAELFWLAATAILTGSLWAVYIPRLILQFGVGGVLRDGEGGHKIRAAWAERARRAHYNAIENLAVMAPLALAVHVAGLSSPLTAMACAVYFAARAAHFVIYTLGLPFLRTSIFLVGFGCQAILALRLFGYV